MIYYFFSMTSSYHLLKVRGEVATFHKLGHYIDQQVWKTLYKIKIIRRHGHLSWGIIHAKVPVKNYLFKRGISCEEVNAILSYHSSTVHVFGPTNKHHVTRQVRWNLSKGYIKVNVARLFIW